MKHEIPFGIVIAVKRLEVRRNTVSDMKVTMGIRNTAYSPASCKTRLSIKITVIIQYSQKTYYSYDAFSAKADKLSNNRLKM